mmetsp:Transcript_1016/g.2271  ORF Transcript_1016/g.2271 Transcript_1016/m.2271 type:complete len:335 (-) Transcript_1016:1716-2720(-)
MDTFEEHANDLHNGSGMAQQRFRADQSHESYHRHRHRHRQHDDQLQPKRRGRRWFQHYGGSIPNSSKARTSAVETPSSSCGSDATDCQRRIAGISGQHCDLPNCAPSELEEEGLDDPDEAVRKDQKIPRCLAAAILVAATLECGAWRVYNSTKLTEDLRYSQSADMSSPHPLTEFTSLPSTCREHFEAIQNGYARLLSARNQPQVNEACHEFAALFDDDGSRAHPIWHPVSGSENIYESCLQDSFLGNCRQEMTYELSNVISFRDEVGNLFCSASVAYTVSLSNRHATEPGCLIPGLESDQMKVSARSGKIAYFNSMYDHFKFSKDIAKCSNMC